MNPQLIYDRIEQAGTFGQQFLDVSRRYWTAKQVLFSDQATEADHTQAAAEYPLMAAFNGNFNDFQNWYAKFCITEIERAYEKGELRALHSMRDLKKIIGGNDPTIYPFIEEPMPVSSTVTKMGGMIERVDLILPDNARLGLVVKQYPASKEGERLYALEQTQRRLADEFHYEVARPETDPKYRLLTYPQLRGDLTNVLEKASADERRTIVKKVLGINFAVSANLQSRLQSRSLSGDSLEELMRTNELTASALVQNFWGGFMTQSYRIANDGAKLSEKGGAKAAKKAFSGLAREIDSLAKYPSHGDFFTGNVLVDREGNYKLHDFRLGLSPIQMDIFDMVESAGLAEAVKQDLLPELYQMWSAQARDNGIKVEGSCAFNKGYLLMRAARGLKKASLLNRQESGQ